MNTYLGKASRVVALRAAATGRAARRDGAPVTACPYDPDGPDPQPALARFWVMGWNRTPAPASPRH